MIVAIMQTGINHHGRRQAAMKITSKLNTINAPVNIDTSFLFQLQIYTQPVPNRRTPPKTLTPIKNYDGELTDFWKISQFQGICLEDNNKNTIFAKNNERKSLWIVLKDVPVLKKMLQKSWLLQK